MMHVTAQRSLLKAVTWRVIGSTMTGMALYAATGSGKAAATFGTVETVIKIVAYFVHERIWDQLDWGKETDVGSEGVREGAG